MHVFLEITVEIVVYSRAIITNLIIWKIIFWVDTILWIYVYSKKCILHRSTFLILFSSWRKKGLKQKNYFLWRLHTSFYVDKTFSKMRLLKEEFVGKGYKDFLVTINMTHHHHLTHLRFQMFFRRYV